MKTPLFIIGFLCISLECFGIDNGSIIFNELYGCSNADTISEKRAFGTLKLNPIQILTSEIPVSFEIYRPGQVSLQIQIGFIFSARKSPMGQFFESWGTEGTAKSDGLISYRKSPYNNDGGINLKIEFRKYKHSLGSRRQPYSSAYFAPQLMYKYTFYNHLTFTKKDGTGGGDFTYYQTESKNSHLFGFGLMFGHQSCSGKFVTDIYTGFGLRIRVITATIHEISEYWNRPGYPIYPNTVESGISIYPFINLGLRMGFELK
jgi:hypothetical protein